MVRVGGMLFLSLAASTSFGGTVFTYQGNLSDAGRAAAGFYDFTFQLADSLAGGNYVAGPVTNTLVVTNGLFTVSLPFGDAVFDGSARWLEIGVRTNNGGGGFTTLSPRQAVTATPYASHAISAGVLSDGGAALTNIPASRLTGTIPLASLTGITAAQLDPGLAQLISNAVSSAMLQAATNLLALKPDLSINTANLPHFQRALMANRPVRVLWLGDSIGDNSAEAVANLFEDYSLDGLSRGAPFVYGNRFYSTLSIIESVPGSWWIPGAVCALTNSDSNIWGGPFFGGYVSADTLQFWYLAAPTNGIATLATSTDTTTWTTRAVVDESVGATGLAVTNIALPPGNYAVRISAAGRVQYLHPSLIDSTSLGAHMSVCNAFGRTLGDFLAMGTNNIAILLTNLNPDLIFYEEKKDVWTRTNWPAVAALFRTYAPGADVCLMPGQISNTFVDYPTPNPTNSSYAVALVDRTIASTNGWAFVDDYTPLSDWPGVVVANGFNADTVVHLNGTGKMFAGSIVVRRLGLLDYLYAAHLAR